MKKVSNAEIARRLAYIANHDSNADAWMVAAHCAGWTVKSTERGYDLEDAEGDHVACLWWGQRAQEWFAFVWMPEATAPWPSQVWWRITHPFAPLKDLPWPHKEASRVAPQ